MFVTIFLKLAFSSSFCLIFVLSLSGWQHPMMVLAVLFLERSYPDLYQDPKACSWTSCLRYLHRFSEILELLLVLIRLVVSGFRQSYLFRGEQQSSVIKRQVLQLKVVQLAYFVPAYLQICSGIYFDWCSIDFGFLLRLPDPLSEKDFRLRSLVSK